LRWLSRLRGGEPEAGAPQPEDELGVNVEREPVAPGEAVQGSVTLGSDVAEGVSVALRFRERSVDCEVVALELTDPEPRREPVGANVTYTFAIPLPTDALPSLSSPHGGLTWTLEVSGTSIPEPIARPVQVAAG